MERSVLFFDIDGTLLSEKTGRIPESVAGALDAAKKAGHYLFINTGRTMCSIPPEISRYPFDGLACGCGTYILFGEEELVSSSLSMERGREIIRKLTECDLGGVAEGPDDVYFPERITRFDRLETTRRYFRERGMGIERPLERADFIYDKLFVYADAHSDLGRFLDHVSADMDAMHRGGNAYEVAQKGYTKASACEVILNRLGIPRERAYVFGDSSNDLPMFEYADHAIALGEHDPVLDEHTEFVTKTVEDDGIAYAIEHYGLN